MIIFFDNIKAYISNDLSVEAYEKSTFSFLSEQFSLTLSREALGPIGPSIFKGKHSSKHCKKYVSLGFYLESVWKSLYWQNKA
jgi:hypothetical protein